MDAVDCQYCRGMQTEFSGHVAAIVGDDHASFHGLMAKALDVVGDTLGGSADHQIVHAVGTDGNLAS